MTAELKRMFYKKRNSKDMILMKVAILVGEITGRGGMETVISKMVSNYNARYKGEMKLFLIGGSRDESWLKNINEDDYYILNHSDENKIKRYLKCVFIAPKELRKFNPDVLMAADEKSIMFAKMLSRFINKKIKVVSWIHFSISKIKPQYRKFMKQADAHFAISDGIKKELINLSIADQKNVYLVYNPIEISNQIIKRPEDNVHFVYVGRLIYGGQKRVNDLLTALSKIEGNWRLTVIGDGEDRDRLTTLAESLGINHKISWLGWQKDPWKCIDHATALLLTSQFEGFPMVLLEAMSKGIPCVSSNCPVGPSDIIIQNKNGWLYPMDDLNKLVEILQSIVDNKLDLPDYLEIQQTVERFDVKAFTENIRSVFLQLVKN
ncbi:MAG: glycosyltransferase [Heyndrickxia coagulans]|uniref:glycosyltransferase n=1 Tax=Heyndrickxia coagulans TaxID=1398 RepID=UPI000414C05E|nr:glycosyltransferase [Heyndrickxia coagulans]